MPRESLLEHLVHWGFQNVPLVEERGDFSVRGGIVDLFPPGYGRPIRLEFDGDRLESIREFNPANQRTEAVQEECILLPMKEFALKRAGIESRSKRLEQRALELEVDRRERQALLESIREGIPVAGVEFLLPYFYPGLGAGDFLSAATTLWSGSMARTASKRKANASASMLGNATEWPSKSAAWWHRWRSFI